MADDDLDFGATIRGYSSGQVVFGRYRLEKILGRGGMGVVWLAHDQDLERDVALKFLPEVVAGDKQAIKDLKRETRRSLELTHPHIIRIYDFVQDATTAAISMEYVSGDTLASLKVDQPEGHFETADIEKWIQQLCTALAYAHDKAKVVHRDLKPANLMIDAEGDLKIADFGIAANISDSVSRVSQQAGSSGTPVYMSPQQMMGEKPAVTDDVYALGATLYDLLTSRPPFHSGNVMMQVMNKVPASMSDRRVDLEVTGATIPPTWESAVQACLTKEAEDRPASVSAVWDAISGNATLAPAPAPPPPPAPEPVPTPPPAPAAPAPVQQPTEPPAASPKKSLTGLWIGLAAALVVIGGGAAWWFGLEQPRREEEARLAAIRAEEEAARLAEEARLAAVRVQLRINSEPAGATVVLDGQNLGITPLDTDDLALGSYPVEVRLAGYDSYESTIEVGEDSSMWSVSLEEVVGSVRWDLVTTGADDVEYWLSRSGPYSYTNTTPDYVGTAVNGGELNLREGRYWGYLQNNTVMAPGGAYREPVEFEVREGAVTTLAAEVEGKALSVDSDVDDPVAFELWGRGDQYRDEQEAWVGEGTLPIDMKVAPGEYQIVLKRPSRNLERRFSLDLEGDTMTEFSMRGATLIIEPKTEDAEILDANGVILATGSRAVLMDMPIEEGVTYFVQKTGYEPVSKSFFFTQSQDAETEVTWDPELQKVPEFQISSDFRRGPSRVRVDSSMNYTSVTRQTINGQRTDPDPHTIDQEASLEYSVERVDANGIRTLTAYPEPISMGVAVYKPNTVIRFERERTKWRPSFVRGGYDSTDMNIEAVERPYYPSIWLNEFTLPEEARQEGFEWSVPLRDALLVVPAALDPSGMTGSVSGRIAAISRNSSNPTATINYTFNLEGPMVSVVDDSNMRGSMEGELTLTLDLRRHFVSVGTMNYEMSVRLPAFDTETSSQIKSDFTVVPLEWPTGSEPTNGSSDSDIVVDQAAVPIVQVQPVYPRRAQQRGIEGRTVVGAIVEADGSVSSTSIETSSGDDSLDRSARDAVAKFKFQPGRKDGEAVRSRVLIPIRFQLQ